MVWVLLQLRELVTLLVIAYALAYAVNSPLRWMERRGIRRSFGVFVILFGVLLVLGLMTLTAVPALSREYEKLTGNFPAYLQEARVRILPVIDWIVGLLPRRMRDGNGPSIVDQAMAQVNPDVIRRVFQTVWTTLLGGYSAAMALANLVLLPFVFFYLAVDFGPLHQRALNLLPILKRRQVRDIFLEMDRYLSAFVTGQLTVCLILSVLYATGLWAVGIETWLILGLIAGMGNMVPYLGFILGITLSSIMALVSYGDSYHLFLVWGVFAFVQALEGTFITPRVLGNRVGLSPLVVILAVVAGGSLLGLLGVFLAVPATAILKVLFSHLTRWLSNG
ncbi:MAG: AI-2E family transporter [Oligoflexia bacterium]|nr:AI-2E family transporter [Oligoflexia bacterium]